MVKWSPIKFKHNKNSNEMKIRLVKINEYFENDGEFFARYKVEPYCLYQVPDRALLFFTVGWDTIDKTPPLLKKYFSWYEVIKYIKRGAFGKETTHISVGFYGTISIFKGFKYTIKYIEDKLNEELQRRIAELNEDTGSTYKSMRDTINKWEGKT